MDRVCVCVSGFSPKGQVGLMNTRGAWNLVCINAEAGLPTLPLNARVVKIAGGAYHLRNCCLYHSRKARIIRNVDECHASAMHTAHTRRDSETRYYYLFVWEEELDAGIPAY